MADVIEYIRADGDDVVKEPLTSHDRDVEALLEDLRGIGSSARIDIYKCNPGSKNADMFCESFPADKFDAAGLQQYIRHTYGGGDYRLLVYKPGKKGVAENKLLPIASPRQQTPNVPAVAGGEIAAVLQTMMAMQAESNQRFERLFLEMKQPAKDPYEEQKKMLELAKMQREAFGIGGVPVAPAAPVDPIEQLTKLVTMVGALKSLGGDLGGIFGNGGGDADDSVLGVVKELGPQLLGAITNHQRLEAAKTSAAVVAGLPARQRRPNPAPRPVAEPAGRPALIIPQAAFDLLQNEAANDSDVDMVAAQAGAMLTPEIIAVIRAPDAFKRFLRAHPGVAEYPEWWLDLLDALRDTIDKPNGDGVDNGNAGQNDTNRGGQ